MTRNLTPHTVLPALVVGIAIVVTTVAIDAATVLGWTLARGARQAPPFWVLMAATAAVTTTLPAVTRRAARLANQLLHGAHVDGYAMMTQFVRRMSDTLAVDDVLPRLAETAARTTLSSRGEVELWLGDGRHERQVWPPDTSAGASRLTVSVQHGGEVVGALTVDGDGPASGQRGLNELVGPAGLALSTVRLTQELRDRLADTAELNAQLRGSQERIVEASRVQRDRVKAELCRLVVPHLDAAEQSLADAAKSVRDGTPLTDPSAYARLLTAEDAARAALEALRLLAQGIFPPLLDQAGLEVALRAWADREQIAVDLQGTETLIALRDQPIVQACLFFCCVSILTDVRDAAAISVSFSCDDVEAQFSLRWSDVAATLRSQTTVDLTDRLEALGGAFLPGETTLREARVACTVPVNPIALPLGR